MIKFGFNPKIYPKNIIVRSYFNLKQANWLLTIGAFKDSPNEIRINKFIEARTNTIEKFN